VHLHVHTEYSLLDGACRAEQLATAAAQQGMGAVAITDHGTLYGVVPFYKACRAHRVKPIIGCEVYVAPGRYTVREGKPADLRHLLLLAENVAGYRNLLALVTESHLDGFYYKPRVDRELLARYRDGLLGFSACLGGEIPALLLAGREDEARALAAEYRDLFGRDRFYLELMDNGLAEQAKVNPALLEMARDLGLGCVATNDVHYCRREDASSHDILLCVQTNSTVDDPNRLRFQGDQFYFRSAEEMAALFEPWPDSLANTVAIAERCQVELEFGNVRLPDFAVPEGHTADTYLRQLCLERLATRYPEASEKVRERLEHELRIIAQRQLATYILITWDLVRFAREQGILVGPGRGSAPGSVVLYVLGVTGVDPLRLGIPFERFMNPERLSMPDVDLDFEDARRDEVIRYIARKYGSDHVAQIITFGTMGPRLAVRDVGRALNMPMSEVDRIAKQIDAARPIAESLKANGDLAREYEESSSVRRLLETAMAIEGLARHASTHAAGVVISREPLREVVPLQRSTEGEGVTTQFDMVAVAEVGLLKMDILGLRTLSVFRDALEMIARTRGERIDLERIPYDDAATFALLASGETQGVFQLESAGMRQVVTELKPDRLEDIIALVALYRPGPMGQIPNYIAGKHGTRKISYLHPELEPILRDTYGVIVYQEQVMETARQLAGLSMSSAEAVLRAMRKKIKEEMDGVRGEFVEGAARRSIPRKTAETIFEQMAEFAGYGFNKAHSASYAINAYQTAYLKVHYAPEFMAAQLTSIMGDKEKVAAYVQECRRIGIEVLPPDVNSSLPGFSVEEGKIRFGLGGVKHVSQAAVEGLVAEREAGGPFRDIYEMCSRIGAGKLNKMALESLAKAGAFGSLPGTRAQQVAAVEGALEWGARVHRDEAAGQDSLFGVAEGPGLGRSSSPTLPRVSEFPASQLLSLEKEYLGAYLSGHPLAAIAETLAAVTTATLAEVREGTREGEVLVGGIMTSVRKRVSRGGKMMAYFLLEDLTGSVEATVLPDGYDRFGAKLAEQAVVVVRGRVELDERWREEREGGGQYRLVADALALLDDAEEVSRLRNGGSSRNGRAARPRPGPAAQEQQRTQQGSQAPRVHIRLPKGAGPETMGRLREAIGQFRGDTEVLLHVHLEGEQERRLRLGPEHWVAHGEQFTQAITGLLGEGTVWVE
jgi:DNA polymerase-3 subunit alpha